jgi:CheY-specific phosphatase CheX
VQLSSTAVQDVEIFLDTFLALCASFSGTVLVAQPQALTESITGNTDFLWLIQFTGAVSHTVIISAQRRFIFGLTKRVFDVDEAVVTDAMATKVSNKLIAMYVDDVKRAFATNDRAVQSGPPIPVAGQNATYQLSGVRALHVPLSSEIGWAQVTVAGGL